MSATTEAEIIAETLAELVDSLGYDSTNGTETIREMSEACAERLRRLREPAAGRGAERAGSGWSVE